MIIVQLFKVLFFYKRIKKNPSDGLLERRHKYFRVWPHLIDYNLHLNNANYLKLMDLARWDYFLNKGWLKKLVKQRINLIVAGSEISFFRELRAFQKFDVTTRLLTWDEKYLYVEHSFFVGKVMHTHIMIKIAAVCKGKRVLVPELFEALKIDYDLKPDMEVVDGWKSLLELKKSHNT